MYKNNDASIAGTEVARIIAETIHKCRKNIGRARLANSLGISIHLLNAYASPTIRTREKESGELVLRRKPAFPARLIELFCELTQDDALQRYILGERLRILLKIGETEAEQRQRLSKLAHATKTIRKSKGDRA